MRHHTARTFAYVFVVLTAMCAAPAFAQDGLLGDWDLSIDFGGTPVPASMTVSGAAGALSGKLQAPTGELEIKEIKYDNGAISFSAEVDMQGTPMVFAFEGKLEGEVINGKLKSDMGEMTVTGKRPSPFKALEGTWALDVESKIGKLEHKLVVAADGGVTLESEESVPATEAKLDGENLSFLATIHAQGATYDVAFEGTFKDGKIAGDYMMDGSSVATLVGTKAAAEAGDIKLIAGQWDFEIQSPAGLLKHTLTVADDGTALYNQGEADAPAADFKFSGDTLSFPVTISGFNVIFSAKVSGSDAEGNLMLDGNPVAPLKGKKAAAPAAQ